MVTWLQPLKLRWTVFVQCCLSYCLPSSSRLSQFPAVQSDGIALAVASAATVAVVAAAVGPAAAVGSAAGKVVATAGPTEPAEAVVAAVVPAEAETAEAAAGSAETTEAALVGTAGTAAAGPEATQTPRVGTAGIAVAGPGKPPRLALPGLPLQFVSPASVQVGKILALVLVPVPANHSALEPTVAELASPTVAVEAIDLAAEASDPTAVHTVPTDLAGTDIAAAEKDRTAFAVP